MHCGSYWKNAKYILHQRSLNDCRGVCVWVSWRRGGGGGGGKWVCQKKENETHTGGRLMKFGRKGACWINNPEITLTPSRHTHAHTHILPPPTCTHTHLESRAAAIFNKWLHTLLYYSADLQVAVIYRWCENVLGGPLSSTPTPNMMWQSNLQSLCFSSLLFVSP